MKAAVFQREQHPGEVAKVSLGLVAEKVAEIVAGITRGGRKHAISQINDVGGGERGAVDQLGQILVFGELGRDPFIEVVLIGQSDSQYHLPIRVQGKTIGHVSGIVFLIVGWQGKVAASVLHAIADIRVGVNVFVLGPGVGITQREI